MPTQLFMIMKTKEAVANIPVWEVVFASPDFEQALVSYPGEGERILIAWKLVEGIKVLRVNYRSIAFQEDFNNIDLPFSALPGQMRSGMYQPLNRAVVEFLKNST